MRRALRTSSNAIPVPAPSAAAAPAAYFLLAYAILTVPSTLSALFTAVTPKRTPLAVVLAQLSLGSKLKAPDLGLPSSRSLGTCGEPHAAPCTDLTLRFGR